MAKSTTTTDRDLYLFMERASFSTWEGVGRGLYDDRDGWEFRVITKRCDRQIEATIVTGPRLYNALTSCTTSIQTRLSGLTAIFDDQELKEETG